MADITFQNFSYQPDGVIRNYIAGEALAAGMAVRFDSSGKIVKASAGASATAGVVGLTLSGAQAGQAVPVLHRGLVSTVSLAPGTKVYLSNTSGALSDAPGSVEVKVGVVLPEQGGTAGKFVAINIV